MHLSPDSIGKQVPQLSPRPNSKQQRSLRDCCDPGLLRIPAYFLSLKKQKGGNQRKRKGSSLLLGQRKGQGSLPRLFSLDCDPEPYKPHLPPFRFKKKPML